MVLGTKKHVSVSVAFHLFSPATFWTYSFLSLVSSFKKPTLLVQIARVDTHITAANNDTNSLKAHTNTHTHTQKQLRLVSAPPLRRFCVFLKLIVGLQLTLLSSLSTMYLWLCAGQVTGHRMKLSTYKRNGTNGSGTAFLVVLSFTVWSV